MTKIAVNDPCCICGFEASELFFESQYPQHAYPGTFAMRRCTGCGLLFNSPRLDDESIRDLYQCNYYFFERDDRQEFARIEEMYARTIAVVEDDVREKRVLEVGSAKGYLLAVLKRLGWSVQGVEVSTTAANYARSQFGVDVFQGMLEDYLNSPGRQKFPVVLAIDVIEHVPAPDRFVEDLSKVVEPGGLLIIDTPNGSAHDITVQGADWYGFNPFHIYVFTAANLTALLHRQGFEVLQVFSYRNTPSNEVVTSRPTSSRGIDALARALLQSLRLHEVGRRGYRSVQRLLSRLNRSAALRRATMHILGNSSYIGSHDYHGELASSITGVNLLVIARRHESTREESQGE